MPIVEDLAKNSRKLLFVATVFVILVYSRSKYANILKSDDPLSWISSMTTTDPSTTTSDTILDDHGAPLIRTGDEPEYCLKEKSYLPIAEIHPRVILLPSYPGSGNTWVRHLIQETTRLYTGSAYFDSNITSTFPGEGKTDSTVIVIKTHYPCGGCWQVPIPHSYFNRPAYDRETGPVPTGTTIIYLIRSPFDTLLAEFNRILSGGNHTGFLSEEHMKDQNVIRRWKFFIDRRIEQWYHHVDFYLHEDIRNQKVMFNGINAGLKNVKWRDARVRPVYVIFYENLTKNPALEIKGLVEWLTPVFEPGQLPTPEQAASCATYNMTGSYKRQHTHVFNPYFDVQKSFICEKVKRVWHSDVWGECNGQLQRERDN